MARLPLLCLLPPDPASATTAITHIAIQEQLDGKTVDLLEQVSDEQYDV